MEEITLRLPAETKSALESEADERGVAVETHVRDIIDAHRADDARPAVSVEYVHRSGNRSELERRETDAGSEEIGSFSYGSRSIIS